MEEAIQAKNKIIQNIKKAFRWTPYPGNENIVCSYIDEGYFTYKSFRKKHWRKVDLEMVFKQRESLIFMTPSAIRFYIPAFMIAALTDTEGIDVGLNIIFFVLRDMKKDFQIFSKREKEGIKAYLEYFVHYPYDSFSKNDAIKVLGLYWNTND